MKILHFGAGKIGRGLIFPVFKEKHDVVLVDSNEELVHAIKANHGYNIIELDRDSENIISIRDPEIQLFDNIKGEYDCDVITTSVFTKNLVEIIPKIKEILSNNKRPVYIIPMENASDARSVIKAELEKDLIDLSEVYILGSVIDRIVPTTCHKLDIVCEKYCSIIVENRNGFSRYANGSINLTDNIEKEFDKKYLLVNGMHACVAYLGFLRNYEYTCEVMKDKYLLDKLLHIGECYIQYLISNYQYDYCQLFQYLENSLKRFSNPSIKDPLSRVGRNLLVKLSPNDRILRPYLYNRRYGLTYEPFEEVIRAAKYFTIGNDYGEYIASDYVKHII